MRRVCCCVLQETIPTRKVFTLYIAPKLKGWPVKRIRSLTTHINDETTVWTGSDNPAEEFEAIFSKSCLLDGSMLCLASDEERVRYMLSHARARGLHVPEDTSHITVQNLALNQYLNPGDQIRHQEYSAMRAERQSLMGTFFAEIGQNVGHGSSAGSDMPCLTRSGEIFCWREGGLLTAKERLTSLGVPVYSETSEDFQCHFNVDGLSDSEMIHLAGNGMHLDVMNAWAIYVMSNVVRRSSLQQMPPPIKLKPSRRPAFKTLYRATSSPSSPCQPVRKRPASSLASSANLEFFAPDEEDAENAASQEQETDDVE